MEDKKTIPAKLGSAAVFHLPRQIERMIAERVAAAVMKSRCMKSALLLIIEHADLGRTTSAVGLLPPFHNNEETQQQHFILGMRAVQIMTKPVAHWGGRML